jgi:hypothetical protein
MSGDMVDGLFGGKGPRCFLSFIESSEEGLVEEGSPEAVAHPFESDVRSIEELLFRMESESTRIAAAMGLATPLKRGVRRLAAA